MLRVERLQVTGLPPLNFEVPDGDCLQAMRAAFQHLKIVLEPGGAVALAAALYQPGSVTGDGSTSPAARSPRRPR